MSNLKNQLIKLGSTNPELRDHLRPVIAEIEKKSAGDFQVKPTNTLEMVQHRIRTMIFFHASEGLNANVGGGWDRRTNKFIASHQDSLVDRVSVSLDFVEGKIVLYFHSEIDGDTMRWKVEFREIDSFMSISLKMIEMIDRRLA